MSAKIKYTVFYVAMILFLVTVGSVLPIDLIDGVTEEQIATLAEPIELPPEPTVIDYVIFPFAAIYSVLNKLLILLSVSPVHQGLALITIPFTIGMVMVIVLVIRGN